MLTDNDRQAELSYAYLHAVATAAHATCSYTTRTEDAQGLDARLRLKKNFGTGTVLTDVDIQIQLKSTTKTPGPDPNFLKYALDVDAYNMLRSTRRSTPIFLVVLFLPPDASDCVHHTAEELRLRRCAYWASLHGMPDSTNTSSVTLAIPSSNVLTPIALDFIFSQAAVPQSIPHI